MDRITGIGSVSIDCPNAHTLAEFYAHLLGVPVALEGDGYASLQFGGMWINTLTVTSYQPPTWPSDSVPAQVHLDFSVDDLDAAAQYAVSVGARLSPTQPEPSQWRVLLDPVGHPFCLTTNAAE